MPINIKDSIESSTIKGSLNGNASTATKATQDSAGQQINKTYIKGLSVSGKTITYTKGDGTTGTITTQDTNTTYSTGTASALGLTKLYTGTGTATDGTMTQAAIKTALDGKSGTGHTHSYLPLSGGTVTGDTTFDKYIKLNAWPNYGTGTANLWFDGNDKTLLIENATNLKLSGVSVSKDGHTHNSLMATDLSSLTVSLNNYNLSSGIPKVAYYFCPSDSNGSNITGRPNDSDKKAFNLVVESLRFASNTDYITKQTYTQGSQKITYVRYCTNGTWTAWEKVYTSTQKPTLSELGAASTAAATTSANGLMTSAMVTKLNGIATNANNYSHPTTSGNKHIPAGGSSGQILRWSADGTAVWGADNNTTYSTGTTSTAGLTKLYTGTGTATDGTMTQAALKTALDGKAGTGHTHSYLPLSGGTLSGSLTKNGSGAGFIISNGTARTMVYSSTTVGDHIFGGNNNSGNEVTDYIRIGANKLKYNTGGNEYDIYHTGKKPTYSDVGAAPAGHTHNYAGSSSAGGAANSATKLATARTINGTSFDGSANITTANWGTARNIYIADNDGTNTGTAVSVNGSANVTLKLPATIKASLTGNASTATKAAQLTTARKIGRADFNGTANIELGAIAGRATIPSSADTNANKFSKFARIDLSGGTYRSCSGTLEFVPTEGSSFTGELYYYFRTGSAITSTSIVLDWKTISNTSYSASVVAVKVSDGVFDLYYKPVGTWDTMSVTNVNSIGTSYMTLYSSQGYVASVTAAATSRLNNTASTVTGNAGTATTLQNTRTINGTSFNGSANITTANWGTARNIYIADNSSTNTGPAVSVNGSGNATLKLPATIKATISGNATTATTLQTARTINGTSFNGSANITTANWGTARTLTIGKTGKSVNGSGNVSWSLSEIGALPLTGGTVTGETIFNNYLTLNAWSGYGTGTAQMWYDGNTKILNIQNATGLKAGNNTVYTTGNKPTPAEIGAAASSHSHNQINSRGNVTAESGATGRPAVSGLSMTQAYNNGYPTPYGNVISLKGTGDGQILVGWAGADGAHAPVYVRSKRDNTSTANWSPWAELYTTANYAPAPHWGTGNPSNSDGRPDGTVYYKYA